MNGLPLTTTQAARLLGITLCLVGFGYFTVLAGRAVYMHYVNPWPADEPPGPDPDSVVFVIVPNLWAAAPWLVAGGLLFALARPLGRWLR